MQDELNLSWEIFQKLEKILQWLSQKAWLLNKTFFLVLCIQVAELNWS